MSLRRRKGIMAPRRSHELPLKVKDGVPLRSADCFSKFLSRLLLYVRSSSTWVSKACED